MSSLFSSALSPSLHSSPVLFPLPIHLDRRVLGCQIVVTLEMRKQEWTAIIPNSQLIVIPFPHNNPRSWSAKLYLTPSNSVLLTAIALIGVCVFILVIIGILHWKEKHGRSAAHYCHNVPSRESVHVFSCVLCFSCFWPGCF
ncbi:hypothetical protein GOODEAATRI_000612 [Goodea atripinnis]|uniref:T-cell immunomodulatory protein TIP C2 domain-containing protein n=1 Tax=Goodea atripinnis TaxID=208336 RepID=A0ABV0MNA2_9TELE